MTAAPVSQVLSEAADLLEKPGAWGQRMYRKDGCMCLIGALSTAAGIEIWEVEHGPIADAIRDVLPEEDFDDGEGGEGLFVWNDREGRTQAEVVAKLREAAALAKEQGR